MSSTIHALSASARRNSSHALTAFPPFVSTLRNNLTPRTSTVTKPAMLSDSISARGRTNRQSSPVSNGTPRMETSSMSQRVAQTFNLLDRRFSNSKGCWHARAQPITNRPDSRSRLCPAGVLKVSSMSSPLEFVQLAHVHRGKCLADAKDEYAEHHHRDHHVEEDADFNQERHSVGGQRNRGQHDPIFHRQEREHLSDGFATVDHEEKAGEQERDGYRERVAAEPFERRDRAGNDVS